MMPKNRFLLQAIKHFWLSCDRAS